MALMTAIGLMSGTSMDGIDVALLETDGLNQVRRGPSLFVPYEAAFRRRIEASLDDAKKIIRRGERPGNLAAIEAEITSRHAQAVMQFLSANGLTREAVNVIGFHGQTVLHRPDIGLTVQLGDGGELARQTGIAVVADMRANDMAHGGQGAPLVPVYHAALAASLDGEAEIAFVNIGGISNVTFVGQGHDPVAFDSGPGNALIDQWVEALAGIPFDDGGRIASEGSVDEARVAAALALPFFAKGPPKSLDRNDFSPDLVKGMELSDGARTVTAITAQAIFAAARHGPKTPATWILCGGGRLNRTLVRHMEDIAAMAGQRVMLAEEAGFNGDAMEAEAWAYLAVRSLKGLPLTFPATTGVREPVTGGVLHPRSGKSGSSE